ncbi:colicin [Ciceribacter sp. RN22]|uniref:colicin n=1 Tax=Ciceribacter sp. RN22 TaxID=2954932 RepID=UPI0020929A00|nr:colicin [Ciceribacter sp. RN22]MCO6180927.1 colicin [Ciceribacter sp. RN22]
MGSLPDSLKIWLQEALITEIYPQIRAIAVKYSEGHEITVRYYLDREPTEFDYDSISMVVAELLSKTSSSKDISAVAEECIFSQCRQADLERLDGFVYARREYDLENNPSQTPTYF